MPDFDATLERLREEHESAPSPIAEAPEWADTEEPRPFRGFCEKCGISLLRRGPMCARCTFELALTETH